MYAPTHVSCERIEPLAEWFSDLNESIDSRADDYEGADKDPAFFWFSPHRTQPVDQQLDAKCRAGRRSIAGHRADLQSRIIKLTFPPDVAVGADVLMEEVAVAKISGEENRCSKVDKTFNTVFGILKTYRSPDGKGFVSYEQLSDKDRAVMAAAINKLEEDLSTLRGMLGLDEWLAKKMLKAILGR